MVDSPNVDKKLLPAVSKDQLDTLLDATENFREQCILKLSFAISTSTDKNSGFLSSLDDWRTPVFLTKIVTNGRDPVIGLDCFTYC